MVKKPRKTVIFKKIKKNNKKSCFLLRFCYALCGKFDSSKTNHILFKEE